MAIHELAIGQMLNYFPHAIIRIEETSWDETRKVREEMHHIREKTHTAGQLFIYLFIYARVI